MRKISFIIILLGLLINGHWLTAFAGVKNATTLCVEDKTGTVLKFALADRPKISFRGNYTVVQAAEIKLLQFRNLYKAYFTDEDDPTAVSEVAAGQESIDARYGTVSFNGFKPLTPVLVYTPAGTLVKKAQTNVDGYLQMTLQDLPPGIYVVKAGKKKAFKFEL